MVFVAYDHFLISLCKVMAFDFFVHKVGRRLNNSCNHMYNVY